MITLEEEILIVSAYQKDPRAAEKFFAGQSGTEPRPIEEVRASIPAAIDHLIERMKQED